MRRICAFSGAVRSWKRMIRTEKHVARRLEMLYLASAFASTLATAPRLQCTGYHLNRRSHSLAQRFLNRLRRKSVIRATWKPATSSLTIQTGRNRSLDSEMSTSCWTDLKMLARRCFNHDACAQNTIETSGDVSI